MYVRHPDHSLVDLMQRREPEVMASFSSLPVSSRPAMEKRKGESVKYQQQQQQLLRPTFADGVFT
jgi:hypothetical protein